MYLGRDRDAARDVVVMRAHAGALRCMQWVRSGTQWRTGSEGGVLLPVQAQAVLNPGSGLRRTSGLVVNPAITVSALAVTVILGVGEFLTAGRHTAYAGSWPPWLQAMLRGPTEPHRRPNRAAGPLARVVP